MNMIFNSEAYSKACKISKEECFANIPNGFLLLTILASTSSMRIFKNLLV